MISNFTETCQIIQFQSVHSSPQIELNYFGTQLLPKLPKLYFGFLTTKSNSYLKFKIWDTIFPQISHLGFINLLKCHHDPPPRNYLSPTVERHRGPFDKNGDNFIPLVCRLALHVLQSGSSSDQIWRPFGGGCRPQK